MDRSIVYPGAIPQDTDMLNSFQKSMIAMGMALRATLGTGTAVDGLACTPTTPSASTSVVIGAGSITTLSEVDPTAYGSLGTNVSPLMQMGINLGTTTVTLAAQIAALSSGYNQNVLIEAQYLQADGTAIVLPYYNASNPSMPYSGPGNSGTAQNTVRAQTVQFQIKTGTATTGVPVSPGADSGWIPLWIITISNTTTAITSSNITQAAGSAFIGTKLPQLRTKLTGNLTLYVLTTGSDTYGSGLSTSNAFATPQAAWNSLINNYDLNGYSATINVGAGTFAPVSCAGQPTGYGSSSIITITGAGAGSTFVTSSGIGAAISVLGGAVITVSNMTIGGGYGIQPFPGSTITVGSGITFGACTGSQILSNGGGTILTTSYTIAGGAIDHYSTVNGGYIATAGTPTVTLTGTPAFSGAFANVFSGQINVPSLTFSGSATGVRYSATGGGLINTGGGGASYFPGSSAGTTGSGTNTGFYA